MKKIIVFLFILTIIYLNNSKNDEVVIPTASIRYRIIANSNNLDDQLLKVSIKEEINEKIMPILENAESIEESRNLIASNLSKIKEVISNYTDDYKVDFGTNYFPQKTYRGINYDSGQYESLVITLGGGLGDNWWCVLYPPLCLIDDEKTSDIEYTTLIKEKLDSLH